MSKLVSSYLNLQTFAKYYNNQYFNEMEVRLCPQKVCVWKYFCKEHKFFVTDICYILVLGYMYYISQFTCIKNKKVQLWLNFQNKLYIRFQSCLFYSLTKQCKPLVHWYNKSKNNLVHKSVTEEKYSNKSPCHLSILHFLKKIFS